MAAAGVCPHWGLIEPHLLLPGGERAGHLPRGGVFRREGGGNVTYLNAFLCGGLLCAVGQILIDRTQLTPARILTGYVVAGVQKLFSRKLYNPYTVFYHTFFDLKLVYEVGPESFLPPPTVKSALLNIKRKHLFFDFKFKAKYLAFISCLLEKPDLSVKTALKSIFRKSQVRSISEKFGLNLNAQIVCLSPSQWLNCFLEMLEVVPEKFHPS